MKLFNTLAVAAALLAGTAAQAQTADEIVQKHNDAIGGVAQWKKVTSMKQTGVITAQGTEIPIVVSTIYGKGVRLDMEIAGTKNYQILTPKAGWSYMPVSQMTKPEPLTAEQIAATQDQLELPDELLDYAARGFKVDMLGKEDIDGTECFKLKVTRKDNNVVTVYIDPKSYYTLRTVNKVKADGKEQDVTMNYSNYQKLPAGITVPMSLDGDNGPITLKNVEVNTVMDESIFKPSSN